ncbi:MAG: FHA domain-containing protein [Planctomycetes bacterium]|nr:FHA domain-containing protein [Planctomycetota bacterium]
MAALLGELVVLNGPYKGRRIPLTKDLLRLGRDATCEVSLDDEAASRRHSEIASKEGKLVLRDLESTNGTYLNDQRVSGESALQNGDRIGVGDTLFLLQMPNSSIKVVPQLVFSEDRKSVTTRLALKVDEKGFLDLEEGTTIPDAQRLFTILHEFMVAISGVLHRPALLERIMDHLFKAFQADRGVILLLTPEGEPGEKLVRQRDGLSSQHEISISRTMAQQVLHKQESFLSVDAEGDERLAASESMHRMKVQSVIGVPLMLKDRVLGMLYLDKVSGAVPFAEMDLRLCTAMALQAAVCLDNASLYSELLNAAEFNNSVLRSLASGLMVVDVQGRIIRVNDAALGILRMEESTLLNRVLSSIAELTEFHKVVEATMATGKPEDRYEIRLRVGGDTIPVGLNASVLADYTGRTVGVVINFRSLTQIRKLEEQVRRSHHLAALGQMAAGVAHEIRNPLNSIRGFTQLIQEAVSKPELQLEKYAEYTQIVLEEVDRMNRIVQDLLDFSRQRELTLIPVRLDQLLTELTREMEHDFKAAQVSLKLDLPKEPLPGVLGNADKLRQVFRNIILNAVQASKPESQVEVAVSLAEGSVLKHKDGESAPEEIRRREIAVTVIDHGLGMEADVLAKIFDPFFTTKDVGTGLGLSISLKIIEQHGGRIDVKSEPGKGSAFNMYLPAV